MNKNILLLLIISLFLSCKTSEHSSIRSISSSISANNIALLVTGHERNPKDKYFKNDIKKINELVKSKNQGLKEIKVLFAPKKSELERQLAKFGGKLGKEDSFFFFYSGHGDNEKGYRNLSTEKYVREKKGLNVCKEKNLSFFDFMKSLSFGVKEQFRRLFVILDACHSGLWIDEAKKYVMRNKKLREIIILTSSEADQESFGNRQATQSNFTLHFFETWNQLLKKNPQIKLSGFLNQVISKWPYSRELQNPLIWYWPSKKILNGQMFKK